MSDEETETETKTEEEPKESPSVANQRREKRRQLLHDPARIRDLAKEHSGKRGPRPEAEHLKLTIDIFSELFGAYADLMSFEMKLAIAEGKNKVMNLAQVPGKQRDACEMFLNTVYKHMTRFMEDDMRRDWNTQISACHYVEDKEYGDGENIIVTAIKAPFRGAKKVANIATLDKFAKGKRMM